MVPHTFIGIAKGADENHLIQEALKLRQLGEINQSQKIEFVNKLSDKIGYGKQRT